MSVFLTMLTIKHMMINHLFLKFLEMMRNLILIRISWTESTFYEHGARAISLNLFHIKCYPLDMIDIFLYFKPDDIKQC